MEEQRVRCRKEVALAGIVACCVAYGAPTARAAPIDVTVRIMRVMEVSCDDGAFTICPDDYYGMVNIANTGALRSPSTYEDEAPVSPLDWTFTRTVDSDLGTIPIDIQIFDEDDESDDDILDITSQGGDRTLNLTLDLTTGTWSGEVPANVGFSSGDHAKILFDVSLSANGDIDGDGIPDSVERFGVRDDDGNLVADLAAMGADPCRKTIAVEMDFMADASHTHRPTDAAMAEVVAAFDAAPVAAVTACPYPGFPTSATGVNFIYQRDTMLTHQDNLEWGAGAEAVRDANFNAARRPYFHYGLFVHNRADGNTSSGLCCSNSGKDFLVSLGSWKDQVGTTRDQSGTIIHELGHALGFGHGGSDGTNCKPNYLSIMSYTLQVTGIPDPTLAARNVDLDGDGTNDARLRLDLSRSKLPDLVENNGLVEANGIGDGTDLTTWSADGGANVQTAAGNGPVDWNTSCVPVTGTCTAVTPTPPGQCSCNTNPVTVDVNDMGFTDCLASPGQTLTGYDDWTNLRYRAVYAAGAGFSPPAAVELDFPTAETIKSRAAATLKGDPAIEKTAPATVLTGSNVTYTLAVTNARAVAAEGVTVTDMLPATTTFVSCAATGGGACGGSGNSRTVTFAQLPGNSSATVTLVAGLQCDVADGTVIANTATVASQTADYDSRNNASTASLMASNPPPVISNVSVSHATLWPPDHRMVEVTVSYDVTDNCGTPTVGLSVTSNEPIEGLGDGDATPDWEILDGHRVRLRAERAGLGAGRIYTVTIAATDGAGGSSSEQITVSVPVSQR